VEAGSGTSDGVLAAMGGTSSGWSLYVRNGRPTFYYNFFEVAGYRTQSSTPLPRGKSTVHVEFTPEAAGIGKPATVKLFVNGAQTGAGRVERTVPMGYGAEGFDVGRDNISPVSPDYRPPFPFSGRIRSVKLAVESDRVAAKTQSTP
jgi:arylsulfatase